MFLIPCFRHIVHAHPRAEHQSCLFPTGMQLWASVAPLTHRPRRHLYSVGWQGGREGVSKNHPVPSARQEPSLQRANVTHPPKILILHPCHTLIYIYIWGFFWLRWAACRILLPRPGIEPRLSAVKAHRVITTELPGNSHPLSHSDCTLGQLLDNKMPSPGTSLPVQQLRLHSSNAEGTGSMPGQGTKIPPATRHPLLP